MPTPSLSPCRVKYSNLDVPYIFVKKTIYIIIITKWILHWLVFIILLFLRSRVLILQTWLELSMTVHLNCFVFRFFCCKGVNWLRVQQKAGSVVMLPNLYLIFGLPIPPLFIIKLEGKGVFSWTYGSENIQWASITKTKRHYFQCQGEKLALKDHNLLPSTIIL